MLTNKIALYIPDNARWVKEAKLTFTRLFGGATAQDVKGAWMGKNGLVEEDITIVYSYAKNDALLPEIRKLAETICKELSQEAVALEVNGGMEFVTERKLAA